MIIFLIVAVIIGWFLKKLFPFTCLAVLAFIAAVFISGNTLNQDTIQFFAYATIAAFAADCIRPFVILFRPRRIR